MQSQLRPSIPYKSDIPCSLLNSKQRGALHSDQAFEETSMKASHFVPRMRSAIMRAIGAAIVLSGLAMLVSPDTYAQQMVKIQLPHAKKIMNDGSVKVTIHLLAPALPSSLRVEGNDVDISAKFYTASCGAAPCEISAKLDGNIVQPGWNYLRAQTPPRMR